MKPSKEYLLLKASCQVGKPFKGILTRSLAIELWIRAGDCRPMSPGRATLFAFEFLGGTYEVDNGDPIGINFDTDNLFSGTQRLAGLVLSELKEQEMMFVFDNPSRAAFDYIVLPPKPNLYRK